MYYDDRTEVFLDGDWIKAKDAKASLFAQTLHYGTGVFDGIRSYNNGNGFNIFKAQDHFQRLKDSAEKVFLKVPYSVEDMIKIAYELIDRNNLTNAYIRPLVYAGPNMILAPAKETHFFMTAWKWAKYPGFEPLNTMISSYLKPSPKSTPVEAKIIGNYSANTLASAEAKKLGFDEAILLDHDGHIAEGPGSNIFYEKDGELFTPKLGNILPGITRSTIMEICDELNVKVTEKDITPEEFYQADHAFFCGTATEITHISSVNGEKFKKKWDDSIGHNLLEVYQQKVMFDEYRGLTIV
ncbi:branched-chain amino acid transaminase [Marinoscillum sp.]|uniref:branched-chain amino acid transaminase n=1 Tax=Marinoscillum sp. TaxID=2024838 RepID=UPI003BAD7062